MTSIAIADDHSVLRQYVRELLEQEADFIVVGEAEDGVEAVRLVEKKHPDILVLDLIMDGLNGFEVTKEVRKRFPGTVVVILAVHVNEAYVSEALQNGAQAYVIKESISEELVNAIREATSGNIYLSQPLSKANIESYRKKLNNTDDKP